MKAVSVVRFAAVGHRMLTHVAEGLQVLGVIAVHLDIKVACKEFTRELHVVYLSNTWVTRGNVFFCQRMGLTRGLSYPGWIALRKKSIGKRW